MKSLVIDTNVLLLLVVGIASPKYIFGHDRLKNTFVAGDFDVLRSAIAVSSGIATTPNILTEVSSFFRKLRDPIRSEVDMAFKGLIFEANERYASSTKTIQRKEYAWLGLADAATLEILGDNTVLISTDGALCQAALAAGHAAIPFDLLRNDYNEGLTTSW